jgi:hypothetical protein
VTTLPLTVPDDLLDALADRIANRILDRLATCLNTSPARAVYSPATLAAEVGCTPRAIRAAITRGDLHAAKRSGRWLIPSDAVSDWTAGTARGPSVTRRHVRATRSTASTTSTLSAALRALDDDAA